MSEKNSLKTQIGPVIKELNKLDNKYGNVKPRHYIRENTIMNYKELCDSFGSWRNVKLNSLTKNKNEILYEKEDIKIILRLADEITDGNLTVQKYKKTNLTPTTTHIINEFGSWEKAIQSID